MLNHKKGMLFLGLLFAMSHHVLADTLPFSPQKGSVIPETFAWEPIGHIFQNPAGVAESDLTQFKIDAGNEYLGYLPISASLVLPVRDWVLGIGYQSFQSNDALAVDATDGRPVDHGTFTHGYQVGKVVVSKSFIPELCLGMVGTWINTQLANTQANAFSGDLGIQWRTPDYWLGLYTRDLVTSNLQWPTTTETLTTRFELEAGLRYEGLQVGVAIDQDTRIAQVQLALHPDLILTGDIVTDANATPTRYSFGTILDLYFVQIHYIHSVSLNTNLAFDQNILGITVIP